MENNPELVRLEQFVDKLLAKYKKLQEMYGALENSLEERRAECGRLKEQLEELRSERAQVGKKVAGLIDRIERWESEDGGNVTPGVEDPEGNQGKLFAGGKRAVNQERVK